MKYCIMDGEFYEISRTESGVTTNHVPNDKLKKVHNDWLRSVGKSLSVGGTGSENREVVSVVYPEIAQLEVKEEVAVEAEEVVIEVVKPKEETTEEHQFGLDNFRKNLKKKNRKEVENEDFNAQGNSEGA